MWARIDDGWLTNPKMAAAGKDGRALWIAGLLFATRELTDGFVPETALGLLCGSADVKKNAVKNLTTPWREGASPLWDLVDGGWMMHDYENYQPSGSKVKETREVRAEAGRRGGLASAAKRQANAQANEEQTPELNPTPFPFPVVSKETTRATSSSTRVVNHLAKRVAEHLGRTVKTSGWDKSADLLLRRGSKKWETPEPVAEDLIHATIDKIFDNPEEDNNFSWANNIQSTNKLREHWDKLVSWNPRSSGRQAPRRVAASESLITQNLQREICPSCETDNGMILTDEGTKFCPVCRPGGNLVHAS